QGAASFEVHAQHQVVPRVGDRVGGFAGAVRAEVAGCLAADVVAAQDQDGVERPGDPQVRVVDLHLAGEEVLRAQPKVGDELDEPVLHLGGDHRHKLFV